MDREESLQPPDISTTEFLNAIREPDSACRTRDGVFGIGGNRNGMVALDRNGDVLGVNHIAEAIFARADALVRGPSGIYALRRCDDDTLQRLIGHALGHGHRGGSVTLPRRRGGRDYLLLAVPLPRAGEIYIRPAPAAYLVIADPDRMPEPTAEWLQHLFGLTAAEARLTLRLFAGATLSEAARDLGTSLATLRVHLAHVFRKTRTARQAELIRLLLSYPWDELTALNAVGA
jgi:DNA-binding CsgD family transcriptional regulator